MSSHSHSVSMSHIQVRYRLGHHRRISIFRMKERPSLKVVLFYLFQCVTNKINFCWALLIINILLEMEKNFGLLLSN